MRILYIFPHPDDESYGPTKAMALQQRQGHEVYLLTLTKGEATKMRQKLGLSLHEMGETRYREMLDVEKVLKLSGMRVLDLPDSGLKELNPPIIEDAVREEILRVRPHVVVTYPVHGISGFHDHLVGHAAVKRVFTQLKPQFAELQRLAFYTIVDIPEWFPWHVNLTKMEDVDCAFLASDEDMERFHQCLDCYVTYQDVVKETRFHEMDNRGCFEILQENHKPPRGDLFAGLKE